MSIASNDSTLCESPRELGHGPKCMTTFALASVALEKRCVLGWTHRIDVSELVSNEERELCFKFPGGVARNQGA